jgi:soluble lytic murein transglycosylase-like protein
LALALSAHCRAEVFVRTLEDGTLFLSDRPPQAAAPGRAALDEVIRAAAARSGLDPLLVHAVIRAESSYDPNAVSPKGAVGLMQLMPATAARYGVADAFDPAANVEAGARYLRDLLGMFGGDLTLALAAYNAGEGAVLKSGMRVPPYRESRDYVRRVRAFYERLRLRPGRP